MGRTVRDRAVRVRLGEWSYTIHIGEGLLATVGRRARAAIPGGRALVVTDERVGPLLGEATLGSLRAARFSSELLAVPAGESSKSLEQAFRLYDALIGLGFDRGCGLVALGGGVVGDLAGFVAATFLRGIPYLQVPTTLLAQVDSSVGGKTAVNHPRGKNLIGAFYQPGAVVADVATLRTLPQREFRSGMAEVVKYGVIADPPLFAYLERELDAVLSLKSDALLRVVAACCRAKARVVEADEREERDIRSILNFGHTFAHALETLSAYRHWSHGEAVAAGMAAAARLSVARRLCPEEDALRVVALLRRLGLPTEAPAGEGEALREQMGRDKKAREGKLRFVLMRRLGRVEVRGGVPEELLRPALEGEIP
ncbi:MAG: 3-dehydroquinate synthase [Nitrospinota bacterium]